MSSWFTPIYESESEHEPEPKPGSFFPVDEYGVTYLGIYDDRNKLTYFTSKQPEIIPEGIEVATADERCIGIRLFKVYKSGSESYDNVRVGTLTVVNDIAWVVGDVIPGEGPFCDNLIQLPPLVCTYPIEKLGNLTHRDDKEKYRTDLFAQMREKLVAALMEQCYDPNAYDLDAVLETRAYASMRLEAYASPRLAKTPQTRLAPFKTLAALIDDFYDLENLEMRALAVKKCPGASIANGPDLDGLAVEASKADGMLLCDANGDTCSINQQSCGGKVEIDGMDIECDGMLFRFGYRAIKLVFSQPCFDQLREKMQKKKGEYAEKTRSKVSLVHKVCGCLGG
ncbi:hypothetical protein OROHE_019158 [Orobanche hederae]